MASFNEIVDKLDKAFADRANGAGSPWLPSLKKRAWDTFADLGFPTRKHEEWKYDNLSFINRHDFKTAEPSDEITAKFEDIEQFLIDDKNIDRIVFVNGKYSSDLSKFESDGGVTIKSLNEAVKENDPRLESKLAQLADTDGNALTALNSAFWFDGAFVYVPAGKTAKRPIHILNFLDTSFGEKMSSGRDLIVVEDGAQARIAVTTNVRDGAAGFANNVAEIYLGKDAVVDYYTMHEDGENSHVISAVYAAQEKGSVFNSGAAFLKGTFWRQDVNVALNDERCEANLNGLYLVNEKDFASFRTLIDHAKPNCESSQLFKGILDDFGKAVYNGKVLVRPDAQQTNAYQQNRNILLTDDATVNAKPQLEIYADDVKCSHGATSGYLDKEPLFYLRSRGIPEKKAKSLILNAFAAEVVEKMKLGKLAEKAMSRLADRLKLDDIYWCDFLGK